MAAPARGRARVPPPRTDELRAHVTTERDRIVELERLLPDLEAGELAEADAVRARHETTGRARRPGGRAGGPATRPRRSGRPRSASGRSSCGGGSRTPSAGWPRTPMPRAGATRRRIEVERALAALDRLARLVEAHRTVVDAHHDELVERRRHQTEEVIGAVEPARRVAGRAQRRRARPSTRRGSGRGGPRSTRPRRGCGWSRRSRCCATTSTSNRPWPSRPRRRSCRRACRPRHGPASSSASCGCSDRSTRSRLEEFTELQQRHTFLEEQLEDVEDDPPRAEPGDPRRRSRDPDRLRRRLRRRQRQLRHPVRHAVPRRHRPAGAHRARRPARPPASRSRPSPAART